MKKKSISSLELAAIVNELQFLTKGKISQIYHQEKKELLLQLHAVGKGKVLLKIIPGKFVCLTEEKNPPIRPTGFCMQLRKYLNNAFIKSITQRFSDRVLILELEKKEKYFLIIELFSKGNIVFTKENMEIIATLEWQRWKDRVIKPKEKYLFPEAGINWKEISESELKKILKKSEKKNLATSLATEIGLGGLYAEEICLRINIDKNSLPKEIDDKESELIVKEIEKIKKIIKKPSGFIYEEEITPLTLLDKKIIKEVDTYNKAINTINPFQTISPYDKKIKGLEKTIKEQKDSIKKQEGLIESNTKKADLIYEKYQPLQKLLDIVKELRKTEEWVDVGKALKKEKKIKSVNLKEKKVVIDI